jgi:hypothetical protein
MSDNYNERVRTLATEMAEEAHNRHRLVGRDYWPGLAESTKSKKINSFMPAARIAVAHMADICGKSFNEGWSSARPSGDMWEESDQLKMSLGLIPDSAQEAIKPLPVEIDVFPAMPQDAKEKAITTAAEGAATMLLSAFMMSGLQTHIETTVFNEPTNEHFRLSLTKILPQEGGQDG